MFGKIIPMETLLQMPLPFVHRLRDIRLKQLEKARAEQEAIRQNSKYSIGNSNFQPPASSGGIDHAMFNGTPFDDIIDELT